MTKLIEHDIIWEEKGMILGIINYFITHIYKLKNIYIDNYAFYKILKKMFPTLKIHKYYNFDDDDGLNIIVKSNQIKNGALIVNNIDNIEKIYAKKTYLLPWFNSQNPIILFKYDKNRKKKNIETIKKKIKKFNEIRLSNYKYGKVAINYFSCNIIFWDILKEYKILHNYSEMYGSQIDTVYKFIAKYVNVIQCNKVEYKTQYVVHQQPIEQKIYDEFLDLIDNKITSITELIQN